MCYHLDIGIPSIILCRSNRPYRCHPVVDRLPIPPTKGAAATKKPFEEHIGETAVLGSKLVVSRVPFFWYRDFCLSVAIGFWLPLTSCYCTLFDRSLGFLLLPSKAHLELQLCIILTRSSFSRLIPAGRDRPIHYTQYPSYLSGPASYVSDRRVGALRVCARLHASTASYWILEPTAISSPAWILRVMAVVEEAVVPITPATL